MLALFFFNLFFLLLSFGTLIPFDHKKGHISPKKISAITGLEEVRTQGGFADDYSLHLIT